MLPGMSGDIGVVTNALSHTWLPPSTIRDEHGYIWGISSLTHTHTHEGSIPIMRVPGYSMGVCGCTPGMGVPHSKHRLINYNSAQNCMYHQLTRIESHPISMSCSTVRSGSLITLLRSSSLTRLRQHQWPRQRRVRVDSADRREWTCDRRRRP